MHIQRVEQKTFASTQVPPPCERDRSRGFNLRPSLDSRWITEERALMEADGKAPPKKR